MGNRPLRIGPLVLACVVVFAIAYPVYVGFLALADYLVGDRAFLTALASNQRWLLETFLGDWLRALPAATLFCTLALLLPFLLLRNTVACAMPVVAAIGAFAGALIAVYLTGGWSTATVLAHAASGGLLGICFVWLANRRARTGCF